MQLTQDKILYGALLVLCIWLPLPLGSNREWAWAIMEVWVFILSILYLIAWKQKKLSFTPAFIAAHKALLLLLCIPAWMWLQTLPLPSSLLNFLSPLAAQAYSASDLGYLSLDVGASRTSALKGFSLWLGFALTLLLVNSQSKLRLLLMCLIGSGVMQSLYGSYMLLSGENYGFFYQKLAHLNKATGTFVNPNHLAGYLEMTLAVGIGLFLAQLDFHKHKNWQTFLINAISSLLNHKIALRVLLIIMVIGLILTRSRMGNIAFFFSLTLSMSIYIVIMHKWKAGPQTSLQSLYLLFGSIILIDLLAMGTLFGVDKVVERVENTQLSSEIRFNVTQSALPALKDFTLTGSGAGSFYSIFPSYRSEHIPYYYDHAHNDYLQFAIELGIPATFVLATVIFICIRKNLHTLRYRHSQLLSGTAFASLMSIISIMIHSTVDFNLQIPANAFLFMQCLALTWIAGHLPGKQIQS